MPFGPGDRGWRDIEVAVRERAGLSPRQFAERLGFDVRTVQNWEQGRNWPDSMVLSLIAVFDQDPAAGERAVFEAVL